MTPFLQFRIWYRRAAAAQRVSAATAAAVVVALLVWTAVPSSTPGRSSVAMAGSGAASAAASTGQAAGAQSGQTGSASVSQGTAPAAGSAAPAGPSPAAGSAGASSSSGGASTATTVASGSTAPTAASPGSTPTTAATASGSQRCAKMGTLRIGVVVPEGAGGTLNSVIGNPPTSQEEADYAAVFDAVNKSGGVDCNNLVGDYATADLTNPSSAQSGCLQFVQDKVFAVLGGFEPLFSDDCLLQAHIPTFDQLPIPAASAKQYYPYYYSDYPTYDLLYKNFVHAVNQMGYFSSSHQFAKLGIFYSSCNPDIHQALLTELASVGVSGSKVDGYDLGCNGAFAPPPTIEQAVLKFKTDGVTTATIDDDIADGQNISNIASQQGFKPKWILPDYGIVAVTNSASEHPNASEFDGAVAITSGQYGAIGAHLPETPGTQTCDKIMTSHGLPTVYQSGDQFAGSACSQTWMLAGALEHGSLSAAGIAAGLLAVKSIDMSFPMGPNSFTAAGTTWGGEFWRTDTYHASCQCWATNNPTWNPSFP